MKFTMRAAAVMLAMGLIHPAAADEVEETLQAAIEAYRAGDIALAKDEVDFASSLLAKLKAAGLAAFLPEPFDGWTVSEEFAGAELAALFGGGLAATRTYRGDAGSVEISVMADNPMVASFGAMLANASVAGSMGALKRIAGQRVIVTPEGEMSALVASRFLVQMSGTAPAEELEAYFSAIDFDGLKGL
ncbi:MAG: hypothetical protein AAGG47_05125 [Pseudomonadota bacterium]